MQREQKSRYGQAELAHLVETISRAIWSDGGLPVEQRHDHQCGNYNRRPAANQSG
jgi:hypothetical protein